MDLSACAPAIEERFNENFEHCGELGASLSVWHDATEKISLADGFRDRERTEPWSSDAQVLIWSATKALAAACLLHACQEQEIPFSRRVVTLWPEFGAHGKAEITILHLLSHQAGLPALAKEVSVLEYGAVIEALIDTAPAWPPGTAHGYHPRTYGFLLDELIRRLNDGMTLGAYWRKHFADPLQLDLFIGVDEQSAGNVAPVFAPRTAPPDDPFYRALASPESLSARAFSSPAGLRRPSEMNSIVARTASFPAFGGIGTARALAKFYAMLVNRGRWEEQIFFTPATWEALTTTVVDGPDLVLQTQTAFTAGLMRDSVDSAGKKRRALFGPSLTAFGHPGAGGCHAFADPANGLAFAYLMNQMEPGVFPGAKCLRLIDAIYA